MSPAQPSDPLIGQVVLARYEIESRLGEGGMAVVYRARDLQLRRPVALKFVREGLATDESSRLRFLREGRVVATLSHPNIVGVYDIIEINGRPAIVMEFVDGEPLAQILAGKGATGTRRLVGLLADAARGVAAAHAKGITHRDLKPANVLVGRDGQAKVADFGLAQWEAGATRITQAGTVVGTPLYMAPEQVDTGRGEITPRSDVYALGTMLYEILTGGPPHTGMSTLEIFSKVVLDEPRAPRSIEPALPRDLETICLKAMEKAPARRYPDAGAFADDLTRHLAGQPILARPPSGAERVRRFLARRRLPLLVAGVGIVAAAVATALMLPTMRGTEKRLETAELAIPLEKDLEMLAMKSYLPGFRMTDADYAAYESLAQRMQELMTRSGESARGWYLVGRCREVLREFGKASDAYERALTLDPAHSLSRYARARMMLERTLSEDTVVAPARIREFVDTLRTAVAGMRTGSAPDSIEADLAEAYRLLLETPAQAGAFCERALEKWKGRPFIEEFLIIDGLASADARQLVRRADEAVGLRPSYAWGHFMRGVGRLAIPGADAAADFDEAIRCNPRDPGSYSNRGVARMRAGELQAAIDDFQAALKVDARYVTAINNLGIAQAQRGDWDAAIATYSAGIAIEPRGAGLYHNRGQARQEGKKDLDGAIEDYSKAVELDPARTVAFYDRGRARFGKREYAAAIADYTEALRLKPAYPQALLNRGVTKAVSGDRAGGKKDVQRAIEVAPADWADRAKAEWALKELDKP